MSFYSNGDVLVENVVFDVHIVPTSIRSRKRIIRLFVQFVAFGVCAGQRKAKSQSKHWDFLLDDVERLPMCDCLSRSRLTLMAMNLFETGHSILTFFLLGSFLASE